MGFKDLSLKVSYDSDEDDVLNDFYIPVLSEAVEYHRLVGYFSSSILALAAEGIAPFINNNGKMRMVVGAFLNKSDVEAILNGKNSIEEILSIKINHELENIVSLFIEDHVKALAWMVANGNLDIKVAIPLDKDGDPLPYELSKDMGIFHQKVGILIDKYGDKISFSGSINESAQGWLNNIEEFKVFRSWISNEYQYLKSDENKFNKYYNNSANNTLVLDLPNAVKNKLIRISPSKWDPKTITKYYDGISSKNNTITLWPHQKKAIDAWRKNEHRGIFAFATGSGKTIAALFASKFAPIDYITIILVPTIPLLNQWKKRIVQLIPNSEIIVCYGEVDWKKHLQTKLFKYRLLNDQINKRLYILSTYQTACKSSFIMNFEGLEKRIQVISDEVHHMGAPIYQRLFNIKADRRLGLSATPERQWDEEGNNEIIEYFGGTVYEYGIKDAIEDGRLARYEYYPRFARMNRLEFETYINLSMEIDKLFAIIKSESKNKEKKIDHINSKLEHLLRERALIKKKCSDKIRVFSEIIKENDIFPMIVFCEDNEQLDELLEQLKGYSYLKYTSEMSTWQQKETLRKFEEGEVEYLVAIRCLDEGLDVQGISGCIIVASSSSTREYVQRRGRILRGKKNKIARMYDILVLPPSNYEPYYRDIAEKLARQEISRLLQLVESADNQWAVRKTLRSMLDEFDLDCLAV